MIPTSFEESNHVLDKPNGIDYVDCQALSVWVGNYSDGNPVVISCWKLTQEEQEEFNRTGRIWLHLWGQTMPPAFLGTKYPFEAVRNERS